MTTTTATLAALRSGQLKGITRLDLACDLQEFPRDIFELADTLEVLNLSIAGQHQFLQARTAADGIGKRRNLIIREDQPAQSGGDGGSGNLANAVRFKPNHLKLNARGKYLGQLGKAILRAEQHP